MIMANSALKSISKNFAKAIFRPRKTSTLIKAQASVLCDNCRINNKICSD